MQLHIQAWLDDPATQTLLKAFHAASEPLRFVGGCVRDAIIRRPVKDIDATTPATPDRIALILQNADIRHIPAGIKHGTITAIVDHKPFEITTLRKDTSCDGRHAEVEFTTDWEEDAERRDFTMNAVYCDEHRTLYDFHNGIEDAKAGRVVFIGDAGTRIQEDALRILRYFRFMATHGREEASDDALKACAQHKEMIQNLSGERIQHEMAKLLAAPNPTATLQLMQPDVLPLIIPNTTSLEPLEWLVQAEKELSIAPSVINRLLAIVRHTKDPEQTFHWLKDRWKLSKADSTQLAHLASHDSIDSTALESTLKSTLRHMGREQFTRLIALSWKPDTIDVLDVALRLAKEWKIPSFPVTGADLIACGIEQGEELGKTLHQLEALWESLGYHPTKEELLKQLKH